MKIFISTLLLTSIIAGLSVSTETPGVIVLSPIEPKSLGEVSPRIILVYFQRGIRSFLE